MIRCSKHTIKYTNINKLLIYQNFIKEYQNLVRKYVNILWNNTKYLKQKLPNYLSAKIIQSIKTNVNYDSRIRQCAATQACSMIKSVLSKQIKRLYKLKKLQQENKDTKYLQRKIDITNYKKPNTKNINVELTGRLVNIKKSNHFDEFIEITQIGNKRKIRIPINHTKVSGKWEKLGKRISSIRLSKNHITLFYEIEKSEVTGTKIIGADQGQLTCLTMSDGQITAKNKHGYDLNKIQDILARRKKGSKGFERTQSHRRDYINWSLNQLNFNDIKELRLEKIFNIRKGKRVSRKLSHWTYTLIKDKLIRLSEDKGFVFVEQDNKFRSQRCSSCGWTHKSNRLAKTFKCTNTNCGFTTDSDLNAACNHEVDLVEIPILVCQKQLNRTTGFYWLCDKVVFVEEFTVPLVVKV